MREFEIEYKFLKAVIEGGVETKPDNVLIYATSNRRHLIKETWKDREDMEHSEDLHRSDTMEEKLSLVNRFGLSIYYAKPNKEGFNEMAVALARRAGITPETMSDEEICLRGKSLRNARRRTFRSHGTAVCELSAYDQIKRKRRNMGCRTLVRQPMFFSGWQRFR